jgi:DNA-binding beta-propeller fold protein YncE
VFVLGTGGPINSPGSMAMLDARSGAVLANVPVGLNPQGLAINSAAGKVYVVAAGYRPFSSLPACRLPACTSTLSVVDALRGRVLKTADLPGLPADSPQFSLQPCAIAVDPRAGTMLIPMLYNTGTAEEQSGGVSIVDSQSLRQLHRASLYNTCSVTIDAATGHAFAPAVGAGVYMLSTTSGAVLRVTPTWFLPRPVVVDEQAQRAIVVAAGHVPHGPGQVEILATRSGATLRTLTLALPSLAATVDERHGRAYVLSQSPNNPFRADYRGGPATLTILTTHG